jgi:hypothetical protein
MARRIPAQRTDENWAGKAFALLMTQATFMPDGMRKQNLIHFLMTAPEEIKAESKQFKNVVELMNVSGIIK